MTGADLAGEVTTEATYVVPASAREAVHGRRPRPRHQGDDPGDDGPARHRGARHARRLHPRRGPRRCSPTACSSPTAPATPPRRPARSRCCKGCSSAGPLLRHLLRQPAVRPGARLRHLQAQVRPPRHQPAGDGPDDRQGRGHRAQPRLRGRRAPRPTGTTTPYGEATVSHVCLNDDVVEGLELRDAGGALNRVLGAVPPGGRRRPHDAAYLFDRFVDLMDGVPAEAHTHGRGRPDCPSAPTSRACPRDRLRADHHRPGLRVRLLRHPGLPGAQGRGPRVILVNSNPATIMTDPEFADATYVEPITPGVRREGDREGAARRAARDPGRPDRAERRDGPRQGRRARAVRRRADRRHDRGHRPRREPRVVQEDRRGARRRGGARSVIAHSMDDCLAAADELGYPMVVRPSFTMGGTGLRHGLRRARPAPHRRCRPRRQPDHRGAPRGVDHRLEGVRARGDARHRRQRRDRLLDREPRPDGRAHRRLDHGRAGDDADRPRVPEDARPLDRHHPRGRRRHRRLQHPVRGRPRRRPADRDRDEPAGLAVQRASRRRPPGSRSRRSPPRSPSATPSTRSPTTSPRRPRRPSSRRSTTSW